jgi:hypothetical protein
MNGLVVLIFLVGFVFPNSALAWFSEDGKEDVIFSNSSISSDIFFSDTYVLLYNGVGQKRNLSIMPDSKSRFLVVADRIDIDIPLNVLSKNAIDPGESIDRLLAVNLRIKKILDEYERLDNRAELLLKDLGIPYLNRSVSQKRDWFTSSIQQQSVSAHKNKLKKDLANVVNSGQSYKVNQAANNQKTLAVLSRFKKEEQQSVSLTSVDPQLPDHAPEIDRLQRTSHISVTKRSNQDLPWVFSFFLKMFQYIIDHKVEVIIFIVLTLFFIALIPMKGRQ